jgi:hypothetical protein
MALGDVLEGLALIRVPIAVLVAAGTPATMFAIDGARTSFGWAVFLGLLVFVIALLHALILGLPAYFLARKFNAARWWVVLVGGLMIGAGPWTIHVWIDYGSLSKAYAQGDLDLSVLGGGSGMAGGIAAWLTWYLLGRRMPAPR